MQTFCNVMHSMHFQSRSNKRSAQAKKVFPKSCDWSAKGVCFQFTPCERHVSAKETAASQVGREENGEQPLVCKQKQSKREHQSPLIPQRGVRATGRKSSTREARRIRFTSSKQDEHHCRMSPRWHVRPQQRYHDRCPSSAELNWISRARSTNRTASRG